MVSSLLLQVMNIKRSGHILRIALFAVSVLPTTLAGQAGGAYDGSFARVYPEAAGLLRSSESAHAAMLEQLFTQRGLAPALVEGSAFDQLVARMGRGDAGRGTMQAAMPRLSRAVPRLAGILDRAHALHWEIYDIYADDRVVNKVATVDAAIDRYLSDPSLALPATPKSMEIMTTGPYAGAFKATFPKMNGLMWASHWLQLAAYDPMMYYATAEDRRAGMAQVVTRFREKLMNAPAAMPTEMPTPTAISPELVRRYPRAAAIFDNLHMLHDVIADALVHEQVPDTRVAMENALADFTDPAHMAVTDYQWMVMSLRHGIYNQGGPAIGTLARSERNASAHRHSAGGIFSGMGSAVDGGSVVSEEPAPGAEPHVGH